MRTILIVIKHEIVTTLAKPSYWIMTFLFPALVLGLTVGTQVLAGRVFEDTNDFLPGMDAGETTPSIGYVDKASLIREIPASIPPGILKEFTDEAGAQQALLQGDIEAYYLIEADYMDTGQIILVEKEYRPFAESYEGLMRYLINVNILGDEGKASLITTPVMGVERFALAPEGGRHGEDPMVYFLPFGALFIFFIVLTMSSGFMLQSVSREKENRTAEILLVSLRPRDLMMGKILGLGTVALLQMAIWVGGGLLILESGRELLETTASLTLPPGFIVWALLYFVLSFLLYGSLMGAVGALAPNAKEGGQITFLVLFPLMIPVFMSNALIDAPNSSLSVALSLFPLTAPVAMITRLASTTVPIWQLLVGLLTLGITTYLFILLAGRFFRADTLLSDASIQWKRVLQGLQSY